MRVLKLVAAALCVVCPLGWANGLAVTWTANRAGSITPIVPRDVAVVEEDLTIAVRPWWNPHFSARRTYLFFWASVRAEYVLRSQRGEPLTLPIRFPAEQVRGEPGVKLDGRPLAVSRQEVRWRDLSDGEKQALRQRTCVDRLFLNPRTHRLYPTPDPLYPTPSDHDAYYWRYTEFGFNVTLQPGRKHRLTVQYRQGFGRHHPHSHQFCYIMATAKYWESWGKTNITVRIPRGLSQFIAIDPWPYSHVKTKRQHIYSIALGRPSKNLHIAIDPVSPVPGFGI